MIIHFIIILFAKIIKKILYVPLMYFSNTNKNKKITVIYTAINTLVSVIILCSVVLYTFLLGIISLKTAFHTGEQEFQVVFIKHVYVVSSTVIHNLNTALVLIVIMLLINVNLYVRHKYLSLHK